MVLWSCASQICCFGWEVEWYTVHLKLHTGLIFQVENLIQDQWIMSKISDLICLVVTKYKSGISFVFSCCHLKPGFHNLMFCIILLHKNSCSFVFPIRIVINALFQSDVQSKSLCALYIKWSLCSCPESVTVLEVQRGWAEFDFRPN